MKKRFLLCVSVAMIGIASGFSQKGNLWTVMDETRAASAGTMSPAFEHARGGLTFLSLNINGLKAALATAPERRSGQQGVVITVPNVNGKAERFKMYEASNFSPALQAQFPEIRSYAGQGIDDPTAHLRLSLSPAGIQTMVLRADKQAEFIEPYNTNATVYAVYNSGAKRTKGRLPFTCATPEDNNLTNASAKLAKNAAKSSDLVFKTFRLAMSCTGEYASYHGGTKAGALAGMNATMTRVNGVYEIDLAVNLILIDNNTDVIYTNANSDPYASSQNMGQWNNQLQNTLSGVIGEANYDIGHLVAGSGGGGNAGCIGCVCVNGQKGSGYTAPANGIPAGDNFDIDYVSHELGHQLGGNHTFSHGYEASGVQTEPGSGSSIMGYAGVTGGFDVQPHSDAYFTYASLNQIQGNLEYKDCAVNYPMDNADFTVNAGQDYIIPSGTAFVLKGEGMDANAANITYNWEQNDSGTGSTEGFYSFPAVNKTVGPNFRSFGPVAEPVRYFPALSSVLSNSLVTTWETVSTVSRTLNFTLTGRDNVAGAPNDVVGGLTKSDEAVITVRGNAGPFMVTSQSEDDLSWDVSSQQTIEWDVAGTTANGINTSNVDILLSTDGGQTFATVLAANTPNDGSETITVPGGISGIKCRIMVKAVGNVFFAVNETPFSIGYNVVTDCKTFTNDSGLSIPNGGNNFTNQSLAVSGINGTVSSVKVNVNASHPYLGELVMLVQNPGNALESTLWYGQCGSADDMDIIFSDAGADVVCGAVVDGLEFKPQEPLSVFNNGTINGNWRLRVADAINNSTSGDINYWSVIVCTQEITASTPGYGLKNFTVYPNPNNGSFTVEFSSEGLNDINVLVHDIRGRQVYNKQFSNTGLFSGNVNLSGAEQGVYLVTVQDGSRKETRKIVVK